MISLNWVDYYNNFYKSYENLYKQINNSGIDKLAQDILNSRSSISNPDYLLKDIIETIKSNKSALDLTSFKSTTEQMLTLLANSDSLMTCKSIQEKLLNDIKKYAFFDELKNNLSLKDTLDRVLIKNNIDEMLSTVLNVEDIYEESLSISEGVLADEIESNEIKIIGETLETISKTIKKIITYNERKQQLLSIIKLIFNTCIKLKTNGLFFLNWSIIAIVIPLIITMSREDLVNYKNSTIKYYNKDCKKIKSCTIIPKDKIELRNCNQHRLVNSSVLYARSMPNKKSKIVGKFTKFDLVKIIEEKPNWSLVEKDSTRGWVERKKLIKFKFDYRSKK